MCSLLRCGLSDLSRLCSLTLGLLLVGVFCVPGDLRAGTREDQIDAARLVEHALQYEAQGGTEERMHLLRWAAQKSPDFAPAHWHSGKVLVDRQWVSADDMPSLSNRKTTLALYRQVREGYQATAEDQVRLADFCDRRGLADQSRAHLTRALELNPSHEGARARLGFVQVGFDWVTQDEIKDSAARRANEQKSLRRWSGKMRLLAERFASSNARVREAAREAAAAIRDPQALPALEQFLAVQSPEAAIAAVEAIGEIDAADSATALARIAVSTRFDEARLAAADRLKTFQAEAYVPALLAAMRTPAIANAELYVRRDGRLIYRQAFESERQDRKEQAVFETQYRRVGPRGLGDAPLRALTAVGMRAAAFASEAGRQNATTEDQNRRICTLLTMVTGEDLVASPQGWWQWWNDQNELYALGPKPVRQASFSTGVDVTDSPIPAGRSDCLAAGTVVWTELGPASVEKICVGDRVLSQHLGTGELAYKPVLRTTVRPAGQLIRIEAGSESIQASGGHPFWVSGKGWVKARQLRAGMLLHLATGAVEVRATGLGKSERSFNMVVADFHTYFAGNAKILSHDNTLRGATRVVVPGLASK